MIDSIWITIITGVISSLISSLIWLYFFSRIRPAIEISPQIAQDISSSDGKPIYIIKIINRSRHPAISVKARLSVITPFIVPEGQMHQGTSIKLLSDEVFSISKFDLKDRAADYAYRFTTKRDLDSLWSNDEVQFIRMKVFAIDSLSGLGKTFEKRYTMKRNTIKKGSFVFGNSFEIK